MATLLDVALLKHFDVAFAFLLIFAVVFAVLNFTNVLKGGPGINAIVAFSLAMLALFVPMVTKVITNMAPWFVVLFVFIIFVLIGFKLFGISDDDISKTVLAQGGIKWTFIIIALIIIGVSLSNAYGPGLMPGSSDTTAGNTETGASGAGTDSGVASGDFNANVKATFFHPKVVGVIFILLLACAAVGMLGQKAK